MVISTRKPFDSGPRTSSPATRAPAPAQPQKPSSPLPASKRFDEMSTGKGGALRRAIGTKLGGTPAAPRHVTASSLLTESIGDGRANCLERAYAAAGPTDRVTLLQDRLDAVGHAVIEGRDGKVRDPVTGRSFASMDAYLAANPRYALRPEAQARGIPRSSLERIFSTAPGSPARHAAIASSGLASVGTVRVADVDPTAVTRATGEITGATSAYDAARSAVQAADQRMAEELALLGPSLTEDERNDFIAAFRADPRYADVYANEAAAAAHLESVLEQHRDTIEAYCDSTAYAHSRPETEYAGFGAMAVMDGYRALAGSSRPEAATRFAAAALADPSSAFNFANEIAAKIGYNALSLADVLAAAVAGSIPAYMAANPSATPQQAVEALRDQLGLAGDLHLLGNKTATLNEALDAVLAAGRGNLGPLLEMESLGTSRLGGAFGAAGLAIAILSGTTAEDELGRLTAVVMGVEEGANLINGMLTTFNDMTRRALPGSTLLGRIAAGASGLGAMLDMMSTFGNGNGINAGDAANLGANAVSIGASLALVLNPATAPVTVPLAAAAGLIAWGASLVSSGIEGRQLRDDVAGRLESVGISNAEGRLTMGSYPEQAELFTAPPPAGLGMSHADAASFATDHTQLFLGLGPEALAFAGSRANDFVHALIHGAPSLGSEGMRQLMRIIGNKPAGVSWQTYLQQQREANMYQGNPLGYALSTAAQYAPAN